MSDLPREVQLFRPGPDIEAGTDLPHGADIGEAWDVDEDEAQLGRVDLRSVGLHLQGIDLRMAAPGRRQHSLGHGWKVPPRRIERLRARPLPYRWQEGSPSLWTRLQRHDPPGAVSLVRPLPLEPARLGIID